MTSRKAPANALYWLVALVLSSSLVQPLSAQIVSGSIVGTVEDPTGAAVPGAKVTLTRMATRAERTLESDERGAFVFTGLEAGEYALSVTREGFKRAERRGLMLATGERLAAGKMVLALGALTETVSVTAAPTAVKTESAENAGVITSDQAGYLPILGRSVESLVTLLPGVVNPGGDPASFSGGADYRVLGSRSRSNSISIDGIMVTDFDAGGGKRLSVSQDAVAEVKILISNYQAEYGHMSSSNLEVVTKSGTQQFHGLASYFKRHEQFNAGNFFDNRLRRRKPIYRYNTLNYNLGGPIYIPGKFNRNRSKAFFFWGQEFWPTKTGVTVQRTMPTERERAGDFSQSLDVNNKLISIRDPMAGGPFPGNVIPGSRVNRSGQALLKLFDPPNFFNRDISKGNYNYIYTDQQDSPERTDTLKIDCNITTNHRLVGTTSGYYPTTKSNLVLNGSWPQIRDVYKQPTFTVTTRYTAIFSPTIINEFQAGFLRRHETDYPDAASVKRNQSAPVGYTAGQFHPEINPLGLVPNATFGGVPSAAQLSINGKAPRNQWQDLVNLDEKLTIIRGPHTFKGGVYAEYFDRNMTMDNLVFNGRIDFGRNANNPLDTGYAYANAALGVYNTYTEASGKPRMHTRSFTTDFFVQDNWKVTRRLTLDMGVRFDRRPWIHDKYDLLAGFVPQRWESSKRVFLLQPGLDAKRNRVAVHPITGQVFSPVLIGALAPGFGDPYNGMVVPAFDKSYPRALADDPPLGAAPRFGFAYDALGNGKTAIRGGFGTVYNLETMTLIYKFLIAQPPLVSNPVRYYGELSNLLASSSLDFPSDVIARDRKLESERIMNFSLGVEQNVGFATVVNVSYVGALGRHLLWRRSINPVPVGANFNPANADPTRPSSPLPPAFLRPTPGYNDIYYHEAAASSNYHSLQVSGGRRFARRLQFGGAWTWSKSMDYNEEGQASSAGATVSPFVPVRIWNYGPTSWDRTHVFKLNYLYRVPEAPWRNVLSRYALNGWQISGITTFQSGAPLGVDFSTTTAVDITGTPSQGARIVVLDKPVLRKSDRGFARFFNTEVFRLPEVGTFGNAAKRLIRGPGINNWDIVVFKDIPVREPFKLQFRCEMYNAFNHTQFSGVDTGARFDTKTGAQVNAQLGQLVSAWPARRMQMGLRFNF